MTSNQTMSDQVPAFSAADARLTLQFLERVSLQGVEAPTFMRLCTALSAVARAEESDTLPPAPAAGD